MRVAALCVAVCFVTGASVTLSEGPAIAVPDAPVAVIDTAPEASPAKDFDPIWLDRVPDYPLKNSATVALDSNETVDDAVSPASPERSQRAALSKAELCGTAVQAAQANNLPAPFFTRLIQQESGFKPDVVSSAGAQGIAQFMPRTASSVGLADPFEPTGALAASAKLLAGLVRQFGNLGLAAAAYNAGSKRVQDWIRRRGKLPSETRQYVLNITGRAAERWTGGRTRLPQTELASPASCRDAGSGTVEAGLERHVLPRSGRLAIGSPVLPTIKAAGRTALARHKLPRAGIGRADRKPVRLASAG